MTGKSKKKSEEVQEEAPVEIVEEVDELTKAKEEAAMYLDQARRIQAEFENYRRRTDREKEDYKKFATESMMKELLSIIDDLDRALSTVKEETDLSVGVTGVYKNLLKMLESKGLREIPAEGRFDPSVHEAMCTVEGEEDDMIAQVFQKGYMIDDKVVRFAKVIVTKKKE